MIDASRTQHRRELEAAGFVDVSEADVDPWSKLLFERDDEIDMSGAVLPPGWTIRPIDVERELPAYVDMHREVFGSANMTLDWRRAATRMLAYRNDLDLVLVDDVGTLEGFCIGWLRDAATGERVKKLAVLFAPPCVVVLTTLLALRTVRMRRHYGRHCVSRISSSRLSFTH